MKPSVSPRMVAGLILVLATFASGQNPSGSQTFSGSSAFAAHAIPGPASLPDLEKARGIPPEPAPLYATQNALTLETGMVERREASAAFDDPAASFKNGLARMAAVYREAGVAEKTPDCGAIGLAIAQRVAADGAALLETVSIEVAANPGCACEIVKSAIQAGETDVPTVVAIVESAINAAPETMRMVSQCAIASVPESLMEVQALLARLDPNAGEDGYSTKDAKSAKDAKDAKMAGVAGVTPLPNPLDVPPLYPPQGPPPFIPPPVTQVDPGGR